MGIKLNGISVPIGGISWEYTESGQKEFKRCSTI